MKGPHTERAAAVTPPEPLARMLDVVVVPRSVLERDGWPEDWTQLRAQAVAAREPVPGGEGLTPDYSLRRMSMGELTRAAYQPLNLAFFREGRGNLALLVTQAWT